MGVRRFRSIEEMPDEHWYEPGDPMLYRAIRRVWELGHRTLQPHFPPGVYKPRTMESKNALQEAWDQANFIAYHERLKKQMAELEGKS